MNKRNIVIAVVLLLILLILPFWSVIMGAVGDEKTETTSETVPPENGISCTVAVSCQSVLDDPELLNQDKRSLISKDGWLLPETTVTISEGASVLDALRHTGIAVETDGVPPYVVGVGGLYAGDAGDMSGWTYTVNGETLMVGCDEQKIADGDEVLWAYATAWDSES